MQQFKLSEATAARRYFYLHLVDATDGLTPETGEAAGQPQISKNGAGFGNTTATLTAISNGAYYVALTAAELDTLGAIIVRYKSANTAEFQDLAYVVAYDSYDVTAQGLTNLDAKVSDVKAKTDNLPTDPADESLLEAAIAVVTAKTNNLPSDPADESLLEAAIAAIPAAPTKEEVADQVWDELKAGHVTADTMGKLLQDIYTALGTLNLDGVWDVQLALHTTAGTFGAKINNLGQIVFEAS